ncbi:MAG: DUF4145 domain-containing protein [Pyrinomonadaceae bacterium]
MEDEKLHLILERLDHISDEFLELREGIQRVILIADNAPDMALTLARKVLEYMIRDVYQRHFNEDPGTRPLENLLQRLVREKRFPARLDAYANTIRKLGNIGTHGYGEKVTTADVQQSLAQLIPILEWYFEAERPEAIKSAEKKAEEEALRKAEEERKRLEAEEQARLESDKHGHEADEEFLQTEADEMWRRTELQRKRGEEARKRNQAENEAARARAQAEARLRAEKLAGKKARHAEEEGKRLKAVRLAEEAEARRRAEEEKAHLNAGSNERLPMAIGIVCGIAGIILMTWLFSYVEQPKSLTLWEYMKNKQNDSPIVSVAAVIFTGLMFYGVGSVLGAWIQGTLKKNHKK